MFFSSLFHNYHKSQRHNHHQTQQPQPVKKVFQMSCKFAVAAAQNAVDTLETQLVLTSNGVKLLNNSNVLGIILVQHQVIGTIVQMRKMS